MTTNAILVKVDAIKVATTEFPKFANVGAPIGRTVFPKLLQIIDGFECGSGKKKLQFTFNVFRGSIWLLLWLFYRKDCGMRNFVDRRTGIVKSYGPLGRYRRQVSDKI